MNIYISSETSFLVIRLQTNTKCKTSQLELDAMNDNYRHLFWEVMFHFLNVMFQCHEHHKYIPIHMILNTGALRSI